MTRAYAQAQKFGANLAILDEAVSLDSAAHPDGAFLLQQHRVRNSALPCCAVVGGLLFASCATASSRDGGWKPKSWCCGISSMSCGSVRHADCICVGSTEPCSSGALAFMTP
jgi:hypothetical protein